MLDLWQNDAGITAQQVSPNEGHDLPATFSEGFDAAWEEGRLFAQSVAGENARLSALDDHVRDLQDKTGNNVAASIDWSAAAYGVPAAADLLDQVNTEAKKLGQPELSQEDLEQKAVEKSRAAETRYAALGAREQTFGSRVGSLAGSLASGAVDPINIATLPIAPETESVSILAAALRWGVVAGVSQAGIEAAGAPFRERVQPGYLESGAPILNVFGAAGLGAGTGGATRALGNVWSRVKTGAWPQSVRDAGNVVESAANVADSNVLPGTDGEAAHNEALAKAVDDIIAGRAFEAPQSVTEPPNVEPPGIVAYHGSPHTFERFDVSHIGAGEGSQSFGHGLYFAENPEVARSYQEQLGGQTIGGKPVNTSAEHAAAVALSKSDREGAIRYFERRIAQGRDADTARTAKYLLESNAPLPVVDKGNLYQVRISADSEHFLDWDKPASQQPVGLAVAYERAGLDLSGATDGEDAVRQLTTRLGSEQAASQALREAGIPGIKYLDQGSRGSGQFFVKADFDQFSVQGPGNISHGKFDTREAARAFADQKNAEDQTRNYVVFDDQSVSITHKNGEPVSLFGSFDAKLDVMMDERTAALGATNAAKAERAASTELPFVATEIEKRGEDHAAMLADRIAGLARSAGYNMPKDEAAIVAARVISAKSDDEARNILAEVAMRPRTIAELPPSEIAPPAPADVPPSTLPETALATPEHEQIVRADIDRERVAALERGDANLSVPVGIDADGNAIMRSADEAVREIEGFKAAAEEIQACATGNETEEDNG